MESLRLVLYPVGVVGAIVMAYEFGKLRHSFGRMLAVTYVAWALVAVGLLLMLVEVLFYEGIPGWGSWVFTGVALLMAATPWAMALYWARRNGRARSRPE